MAEKFQNLLTVLALIIRTVKNNYYLDRSGLNRKKINPRGVFECIRAVCHLKC